MNESLRMPVFTFNWPDACSPHAQALEDHVMEWVNDQQLIPDSDLRARMVRTRAGWLVARCYPTEPLAVLKTTAEFTAWLFLVDDLFFDRVDTVSPHTLAHITAIIDVLDLNTTQPQPVYGERALFDICQRLRQQLDAERFQHFAHGTRMLYAGAALQILAHLGSKPITQRQYACIRRHGSGVIPSIALIDNIPSTYLEGSVRFGPELEQLKDSANTIISLSNDIFSLEVECKQPGQYQNMVTLLAGQQQELQQGIDKTATIVRTEIEQFTELSDQLLAGASASLTHYIYGLRYWLIGHQRWMEDDTERYSSEFSDHDADQRLIASNVESADKVTAA